MKRRLLGDVCIGLGNPNPDIFDNKWSNNEKFNNCLLHFFNECVKNFRALDYGFDFNIDIGDDYFHIKFGIEPAYKFDPYICFVFSSNLEDSYIERGMANGYYGSDITIHEHTQWNDMDEDKGFRWLCEIYHEKLMSCLENK